VRRNSRQRGRLRWTAVAAVAAAGAMMVTGCGQTRLGAAALYDNQRISSAQLAAQVSNLNAGYQAEKSKVQIQYTTADMPRQVLSWLLRFAITERVAMRTGIKVSPAEAQAQLSAEKVRASQAGDTLREAAVLNGLPPDLRSRLGRWIAIQLRLQAKLDHGVPPRTTAEQQALLLKVNHVQCLAAKSLHIQVNPQYGAYDYNHLVVVQVPNKLAAAPGGGKRATAPAPQLAPKC
jgi:hypothetical protein